MQRRCLFVRHAAILPQIRWPTPCHLLCSPYTVSIMPFTAKATGIAKSFGDHRALNDVDLLIETGPVLALLGPNGAGKTTMVRILATLVRPDEGTALVAGHDLVNDPIGVKRSISLTGQFAAIDDLLTGEENLEMMAQLRHLS